MIGFGESNLLDEEERLICMYNELYGKPSGEYDAVVEEENGYDTPLCVVITKLADCGTHSYEVSRYTKADLIFDYITKDWTYERLQNKI